MLSSREMAAKLLATMLMIVVAVADVSIREVSASTTSLTYTAFRRQIRETENSAYYLWPDGREGDLIVATHLTVQCSLSDAHIQLEGMLSSEFPEFLPMSSYRISEFCCMYVFARPVPPQRCLRFLEGNAQVIDAQFSRLGRFAAVPTEVTSGYDLPGTWWPLEQVGMYRAWDVIKGGGKVVVAVLDTGINPLQRDLSGALWVNPHELPNELDDDGNDQIDDIDGWDFFHEINNLGEDRNPCPVDNHGTEVAGIIAAEVNTELTGPHPGAMGVAGAWATVEGSSSVKLMNLRIGTQEHGSWDVGWAKAIDYATSKGASIISMSINVASITPGDSIPCVQAAMRRAIQAGVGLVSAVGNDNQRYPIGYPANSGLTLAVGGTQFGGGRWHEGASGYGSNTGPWISVVAPAGNGPPPSSYQVPTVGACAPEASCSPDTCSAHYTVAGTSMSTGIVAGLAALVKTVNPALSWEDVKDIVKSTATRSSSEVWTEVRGFGEVCLRFVD